MVDAFPIKFCQAIRSRWRSRKYRRLRGSTAGGKVVHLGGGRQGPTARRRFWKLRTGIKFRPRILSPVRLLSRLRDAYINFMLGLAGKGSSVSVGAGGQEALLARRIPKAKTRSVRYQPGDFEQRLILEIYKSVVASNHFGDDKLFGRSNTQLYDDGPIIHIGDDKLFGRPNTQLYHDGPIEIWAASE